MRVATLDIGTNTTNLLVAAVDAAAGAITPIAEDERCPRLGQGVDGSGNLHPDAIARVVAAARAQAAIARERGVQTVYAVTTSAARDAGNTPELLDALAEIGVRTRVLCGAEEARWTFEGALTAFPDLSGARVLDIGGGSTEVVAGTRAAGQTTIDYALSVQTGCVRLTERHLVPLPPGPEPLGKAMAEADRAVAPFTNSPRALPVIAVAGTPTEVAALEHPERPTEGAALTLEVAERWLERLAALDAESTLALAPTRLAGRADVLLAGTLLLARCMRALGAAQVLVSGRGLHYGWALAVARGAHTP